MASQTIKRQKSGKGFAYYDDCVVVCDKDTLDRIKSLAIPPAWSDVVIAKSPKAKVLARGKDAVGRIQAIYNPSYRARQEKIKFSRMIEFAAVLPKLRRQVEHDLGSRGLTKEKVLACIVKLIDEAYFRVGNDRYAKENNSYGITTMRSKHVAVTSYSVTFDFMGKSGQHHTKKVADRRLARIIKQLNEMPGHEIFRYGDEEGKLHNISAADVNAYIKNHTGKDFTAKDFRTWGGTLLAVSELATFEAAQSKTARKTNVSACVKNVASKLGNTPAIARKSYIDPRVFDHYLKGQDFAKVQTVIASMRVQKYISKEERCVLQILQSSS
jgi:DNA topoisomerase-1